MVSITLQCYRDNWKRGSGDAWETPVLRHGCLVSAHVSSLCHGKAGLVQWQRRFSVTLWNLAVVLRAARFVCMRQDGRVTKATGEDSSMVVSLVSHCKRPPCLSTKENLLSLYKHREAKFNLCYLDMYACCYY